MQEYASVNNLCYSDIFLLFVLYDAYDNMTVFYYRLPVFTCCRHLSVYVQDCLDQLCSSKYVQMQ